MAVVDVFQAQVGNRPLEELEKEGQVGLTVLWSILGGSILAAGLMARRPPIRVFGLSLLGLATAKVFWSTSPPSTWRTAFSPSSPWACCS